MAVAASGVGEGSDDETNNSKFAKRTWNVLWNQRNRKIGWGRRRLNPNSVPSCRALRPFTANTLRCEQPASPRLECFYHIAAPRLRFTTPPNPGTIFSGNQNRP